MGVSTLQDLLSKSVYDDNTNSTTITFSNQEKLTLVGVDIHNIQSRIFFQ
jgi:hypothetical protein